MPDRARQSIAVIGGSGFIGTQLIRILVASGANPRIGDLVSSAVFPELWMACDVRRAASLKDILAECGTIFNLAAAHRDDVRPVSRYHETNVGGAEQVCSAARESGARTIVFTSSVAIYGFHPFVVDEEGPLTPFSPYGVSKLAAEKIYRSWAAEDPSRCLIIVRPTVVFGEGNRGNVYNLLRQIASGRFFMVGSGANRKSMAYVDNVAEALVYCLSCGPGIHVFNYVDTPDMDMNSLVSLVYRVMEQPSPRRWSIPEATAIAGGHTLDAWARLTGRSFSISAERIRKFCAQTIYRGDRLRDRGFSPSYTLEEGLVRTIRSEFAQS